MLAMRGIGWAGDIAEIKASNRPVAQVWRGGNGRQLGMARGLGSTDVRPINRDFGRQPAVPSGL